MLAPARFAVIAAPALLDAATALTAAITRDEPAGFPAVARQVGAAWVDTILDGFVLTLAAAARGPGSGQRTATMIRDLAESLIGASVRRTDRARAVGFAAFLDQHLTRQPPTVGFAVEPGLAAAVGPALADATAPAPVLADALHATIDAALARLLDEPLGVLGLGLVTRTAARLGRATIARRVHAEVDRAVLDPVAQPRLAQALTGYYHR
ncbi:MAG: hypothetical protein R3B06_15885 [Kofleriaceae bacterium]